MKRFHRSQNPYALCVAVAGALAASAPATAEDRALHTFESRSLTDVYFSEGAAAGDINGDGTADIVYGPHWYAGPDYRAQHEIYPAKPQPRERYADHFFAWIYDFNGDRANDVFVVGFPGTPAYVYENPGPDALDRLWTKHEVFDWVSNESPQLTNIVGDERPELVCTRDGQYGYATIDWARPFERWTFHAVSEKIATPRFGHGLGVGDVNGDGRQDILFAEGWLQQPAVGAGEGPWTLQKQSFSNGYGGAEMYAYDVDGDGDNDVITSLAAHDFGLAWYEQFGEGDAIAFRQHLIMGDKPEQNRYGLVFSELHSVNLADIDGDGLKDIVTGKTYYSHHQQSPLWDAGAVVYWFKLARTPDGVDWIPYRAADDSGIGRQVVVHDVNGDELPDIVVGGMKGAHVLIHRREAVNERRWQEAQPKVFSSNVPAQSSRRAGGVSPPQNPRESQPRQNAPGTLPADASGRPLNLDFETGTLVDWTAEGRAFAGQPVKGDTVFARRRDMRSAHQGAYWIGGYEVAQDAPVGTLSSVPFRVTHPWASFLMNGGDHIETRVELVRQDSDEVVYRITGQNREDLRQVVVDLRAHDGKEIFIRLVDEHRGGWGHVNFDDFRFHETRPGRVTPPLTQLVADDYPHGGLSAEDAARAMKLPDGFSVTAFASEPDVKQPIAMALDDRGRVWIAEAYEYPQRAPEGKGRDRVLILEDTDGDGRFDERKVFAGGLNLVSGLEVGFGGVWVGAAPYLLFIPDRDADDVPDAEPQVLLDGWGYQDTHETLNAFIWGPDGWLYGCHGVFTHSLVGKPGTPQNERVPLNAAIWRYHPTRHVFEVFAHGTSNPWGVDFNDHGQAFCTACVIPHLFHVIQGARYQRQAGPHFNPYTYGDIKTIADHLHYLGANPHGGNDKSDAAGGGHAHAGAMIYLGGAWPARYRNQIFMNNIHGQRLNMDTLAPRGSGYVGSHGPDFLLTGDRASQILNLRYGPDGQAYMIDWYDMQACHRPEAERHDRSNGRIYKIVYGQPQHADVDLKRLSNAELAELVLHENDWYVKHSRRILQERAAAGTLDAAVFTRLAEIATTHPDDTRRLRAVWALHVTRGLTAELMGRLLTDRSPYVRGWAVQLALEEGTSAPRDLLEKLAAMAEGDDSQVVRLYLASALQRLPLEERWPILESLAAHPQDSADHNLPLMYWYAAEPLADLDAERALAFGLAAGESIPLLREFMLRRIGSSDAAAALAVLVRGLGKADKADLRLTFLKAIRAALRGQRRVAPPADWNAVYAAIGDSDNAEVRLQARALGVTFGDQAALAAFRELAASTAADVAARREALEALLAAKDEQLVATLHGLLDEPALRDAALLGLAQYSDPQTPAKVLAAYQQLTPSGKRLALGTLCSRPEYGVALLTAIEQERFPGADLTADLVRQLGHLRHADIDRLLKDVWGNVRETAADKAALIAEYTGLLASPADREPDLMLGRSLFAKTCQRCHVLYGVGAAVGPDLTGSNRSNLEYLLSNIVDPGAVMAKEYRQSIIVTEDGRVITGIVRAEDARSVTIQTAEATVIVPVNEIDERVASDKSMMPDDQLKQLGEHDVRSLFAYLSGKQQVPMLATSDNASPLFGGADLAGWTGDERLWSVENGEIVGRTSGLSRNEFLVSDLAAEDFRLTLDVKLVDNAGNSGIQFRSTALPRGEVKGYQADIGAGWWGKLYEEHGRALLWDKSGEPHVRPGEWNTYEVLARGSRIQTRINGNLCVDLDDPTGARRGIFALQLHSGGPTEVRFRNLRLKVLGEAVAAAAGGGSQ